MHARHGVKSGLTKLDLKHCILNTLRKVSLIGIDNSRHGLNYSTHVWKKQLMHPVDSTVGAVAAEEGVNQGVDSMPRLHSSNAL